MFIALVFGVIGYIMNKSGFPAAPVILGVILGPIAEDNLGRALMSAYGDWSCLIKSPISLFFYGIAIASIVYSLKRKPGEHKSPRKATK